MKSPVLLVLLLISISGLSQELFVTHTRCENKNNPIGIENTSPSLSWQLKSKQRGVLQTAYRILVADDSLILKSNTGNIWDSKKITSDESIQVKYKGVKLSSAKRYFWKVMVWD